MNVFTCLYVCVVLDLGLRYATVSCVKLRCVASWCMLWSYRIVSYRITSHHTISWWHDMTWHMRHATCDMRHATCDMRHVTCDMLHMPCRGVCRIMVYHITATVQPQHSHIIVMSIYHIIGIIIIIIIIIIIVIVVMSCCTRQAPRTLRSEPSGVDGAAANRDKGHTARPRPR